MCKIIHGFKNIWVDLLFRIDCLNNIIIVTV